MKCEVSNYTQTMSPEFAGKLWQLIGASVVVELMVEAQIHNQTLSYRIAESRYHWHGT